MSRKINLPNEVGVVARHRSATHSRTACGIIGRHNTLRIPGICLRSGIRRDRNICGLL